MKLFKRKKSTTEPANIKDAQLPELSIIIDGQAITPVHNQKVLELVAWEMQNKPQPENAKETNMHITNFYVYHSLKEGVAAQNLPFPWSPIELYYFIDLEDYGRIIDAANKTYGMNDESYKSGKLKTQLN